MQQGSQSRTDSRVEGLRVLGALAVFTYHFMGDAESVAGAGGRWLWDTLRTGSGPFGVTLFIVLSGVVFSWSSREGQSWRAFVARRLRSLFPLYWWVAIPLVGVALVTGAMSWHEMWKVPIWLTGLGIIHPSTFFPLVDGWWYMTLALQLVLVYPLLRGIQNRVGWRGFLILSAAVSLASVMAFSSTRLSYLLMGFAGSRLLEFAVGMTLGVALGCGETISRRKARCPWLLGAVAAIGFMSPGGIASALAALAAIVVLGQLPDPGSVVLRSAGAYSFAFFLSHSPWAKPILRHIAGGGLTMRVIVAGMASLACATAAAWLFQSSFALMRGSLQGKRQYEQPGGC